MNIGISFYSGRVVSKTPLPKNPNILASSSNGSKHFQAKNFAGWSFGAGVSTRFGYNKNTAVFSDNMHNLMGSDVDRVQGKSFLIQADLGKQEGLITKFGDLELKDNGFIESENMLNDFLKIDAPTSLLSAEYGRTWVTSESYIVRDPLNLE